MPKEYTKCVEAKVKAGTPRKKAKSICAAAYSKKHGMTVKQAHAKGVEEVLQGQSVEDLRKQLSAALQVRYGTEQPGGRDLYPYLLRTYVIPKEIVFELGDDLFALSYEVDADGEITLGTDLREVEQVYRLKEETLEDQEAMIAEGTKAILLEVPLIDFELEEVGRDEKDGSMHFRGTALIDNARSANRRFYSKEANDAILAATEQHVKGGGIVTIYSRHGKAIPPPGGVFPTGLPIGKVPKLYRDGGRIRYEAEIYPTVEGKDVMTLVERGAMRHTSIRAHTFKSRLSEDDEGNIVENMIVATIAGIDLCDEAGIAGAGIDEVLEEAPRLTNIQTEEVVDMDFKELTLEQLKEQRPDLLDEHAISVAEALKIKPGAEPPDPEMPHQLEELEGKFATVLEEQKALKVEKDTWEADKADLEFKLKIQEVAQIGAGKAIAEALTEKVDKVEDLAEVLPEVRKAVLEEYMASLTPDGGDPEGKKRFETEEQVSIREKREKQKEPLTEDQTLMIEFAGGMIDE